MSGLRTQSNDQQTAAKRLFNARAALIRMQVDESFAAYATFFSARRPLILLVTFRAHFTSDAEVGSCQLLHSIHGSLWE